MIQLPKSQPLTGQQPTTGFQVGWNSLSKAFLATENFRLEEVVNRSCGFLSLFVRVLSDRRSVHVGW